MGKARDAGEPYSLDRSEEEGDRLRTRHDRFLVRDVPTETARRRSARVVLVVAAEPVLEFSFLAAPAWRAVE
jgi:hypothetical protein